MRKPKHLYRMKNIIFNSCKSVLIANLAVNLCFFFGFENCGIAQTNSDIRYHLKDKLDNYFSHIENNNHEMGSIAISRNGKIIYQRSMGCQYISSNEKIKATAETKYRIGSITKTFTATLVFQLIEEGKVYLGTTLDRYFPAIPNAKEITIEYLLNHRSGIHNFTEHADIRKWEAKGKTKKEMLTIITGFSPDFSPGEKASYSNSNYVLLGFIIESITGKPYKDVLKEKIISVLGMNDTYYGGKTNILVNESFSYKFKDKWELIPEASMSVPNAAGAIISTPTDLTTFISGLFSGKLLKNHSLIKMTTLTDGFGLGMGPVSYRNLFGFGHIGSIDGFTSSLYYLPEDSLAIAYCSNNGSYNSSNIVTNALNIFYSNPSDTAYNGSSSRLESVEDNPSIKVLQTIPSAKASSIDSIFGKSSAPYSEGSAIGIFRNDSLIYSKGYGPAKYINAQTVFYMGSLTPQFTAYSILLLSRKGKLKLQDDIHNYMPWIPDFGKKITIKNLLEHTSGLRDLILLAKISGIPDGMLSQELAMKLIKKQKDLNFNPGTEFLYSYTNYFLLAQIVEYVSGKSFKAFVDSFIFKPLKINNSYINNDFNERIKISTICTSSNNVYTIGNGGLYSNMGDMSKWMSNLNRLSVENRLLIKQLSAKGKLNNGKEVQNGLYISKGIYKGWEEYWSQVTEDCYSTQTLVFPDLNLGFIILNNSRDFQNRDNCHELANHFILDTTKKIINSKKSFDMKRAILKDSNYYKRFTGTYTSNGKSVKFYINKGILYLRNVPLLHIPLLEFKRDTFQCIPGMGLDTTAITVFKVTSRQDTVCYEIFGGNKFEWKKLKGNKPIIRNPTVYTGAYYCPELDVKYTIILENQQLLFYRNKNDRSTLEYIGKDQWIDNFLSMNLTIFRNKDSKIIGLEMNNNWVKNLKFNKVE